MSKLKTIIRSKQKYLPIIILIIILFLGAFFRLYRIREYITFLGDEGRDVLVVKRMIVDRKFTLLGPITSVGAMYMGPIYYYFMVPFLLLANFDPVGPAIMVALFAIGTIFLLYLTGKEFFHPIVGIVSAFLYAISPLPIIYGRSSWNPNIVPFFSLLLIFCLLGVIVKKRYRWLTLVGFCLGILFQLHYVTFIFFPIVAACLFIIRFRLPVKNYLTAILAFLIAYSPFLLFELRHQFVNTNSVIRFILTQRGITETPFLFSVANTIADIVVRLFWRLIVIENAELTKLFIVIVAAASFFYWQKLKNKVEEKLSVKVIFLWIIVGIISFSVYQGVIYDYYFGSLFTAPFLLTGVVVYILSYYSRLGKALAIFILVGLAFFQLKNSPLKIPPNNLVKNTETISRFVYKQTGEKSYNFALIAARNSDHAYRYFLEIWGHPPTVIQPEAIDPARESVTDQLLVVCEEKVCQPLGHPLWEIAGFGRAEIVGQWQVATAYVFRLVHYNKGQSNGL